MLWHITSHILYTHPHRHLRSFRAFLLLLLLLTLLFFTFFILKRKIVTHFSLPVAMTSSPRRYILSQRCGATVSHRYTLGHPRKKLMTHLHQRRAASCSADKWEVLFTLFMNINMHMKVNGLRSPLTSLYYNLFDAVRIRNYTTRS